MTEAQWDVALTRSLLTRDRIGTYSTHDTQRSVSRETVLRHILDYAAKDFDQLRSGLVTYRRLEDGGYTLTNCEGKDTGDKDELADVVTRAMAEADMTHSYSTRFTKVNAAKVEFLAKVGSGATDDLERACSGIVVYQHLQDRGYKIVRVHVKKEF